MALVNIHFLNLQSNYLFADIAKKVNAFKVMHPKADVISSVSVMSPNRCALPSSRPCTKL